MDKERRRINKAWKTPEKSKGQLLTKLKRSANKARNISKESPSFGYQKDSKVCRLTR